MRLQLLLLLSLAISGCSQKREQKRPTHSSPIGHVLPDASLGELQEASKKTSQKYERNDDWQKIIESGSRVFSWINELNKNRTKKLEVYSAQNLKTYPIDSPAIYNEEIILQKYQEAMNALPVEVRHVISGVTKNFPTTTLMPEEIFLTKLVEVVRTYETALRWELVSPNIDKYYKSAAKMDVRGYHYFTTNPQAQEKLRNWNTLSDQEKDTLATWLIGMCLNEISYQRTQCEAKLQEHIKANSAIQMYLDHKETSQSLYESFFSIPEWARRNDLVWSEKENEELLNIPFVKMEPPSLQFFFTASIEALWRLEGWSIKLDFISDTDEAPQETPRLKLTPGSSPHVKALGGSQLNMDTVSFQHDFNTQQVLAHEFGHILGIPDCYVEFYSDQWKAMVNYQIDTSNIMCTRQGRVLKIHYDELRKSY